VGRSTWTAVRDPVKTKNKEKIKQLKPKPVGLKVRPIRTVIGQKKE
jgi:hypothetical protein